MSTRNELRIRQIIWAKYRAGISKEQAYINLASDSISQETINDWYKRFKSGDISLFDKESPQHGISQAIQIMPDEKNFAESLFLTSNNDILTHRMFDTNGRFAIFSGYGPLRNTTIIFSDLFYGEIREVEIIPKARYGYIDSINMLGQQHLLMNTQNGFVLLKVDYKRWEVSVVSRPNSGVAEIYDVVVDQLDPRKVFISDFGGFVIGNLVGDKIVFNPRREFVIDRLHCKKLADNKLYGLHSMGRNNDSNWMWQYHKTDLNALTEEIINVHFTFDRDFRIISWKTNNNFQAGKRLYVVFYVGNGKDHIYAFNTDTSIWEDTRIVIYGEVLSLFVDQNDILTIQTVGICSKKSTFYRFALKKPDSLKNLAWLTIRRSAVLFNGDLYDRIRPRLPYGRGLRSLFISDFE